MTPEQPRTIFGKLPPPVSDSPWSGEFVMQSLEVLPLFLRDGQVWWLRPQHAGSLRVGWPASDEPARRVVEALAAYGLVPRVVHSTSWRHQGQYVVLTFVAVVPTEQAPGSDGPLLPRAVERVGLARGDAAAPPDRIEVDQVVEHALRHLAWLVADDPAVGRELAGWTEVLASYEPEPFRTL